METACDREVVRKKLSDSIRGSCKKEMEMLRWKKRLAFLREEERDGAKKVGIGQLYKEEVYRTHKQEGEKLMGCTSAIDLAWTIGVVEGKPAKRSLI